MDTDTGDLVGGRTATEAWTERIKRSGAVTGFRRVEGGRWQDVTWREADLAAREIAGGLASLGVKPGDAICILSQTRLEWVECELGILLAGAVTVPVYASSTSDQCLFIARDAGAKVIFAEDAAQAEKVRSLLAGPGVRVIQIEGEVAPATAGVHTLAAVRAAGRTFLAASGGDAGLARRSGVVGPQDTFTIIYTSGTTGNPKGVILTHENLISGCTSAIRALVLKGEDHQYLFLPLAHVLGREILWASILVGAVTSFSEGITKIKDNLVQVRPTFMAGVPRIFEKFYAAVQAGAKQGSPLKQKLVAWGFGVGARWSEAVRSGQPPGAGLRVPHAVADKVVLSKLRRKLGLDRCRFIFSGGAPLAPEIAVFFHSVGLLILEGYGLTETMAAAFVNTPGRYRFGTVGPALDVVQSRIADDGEILVRGPSIFRRYHANPAATAEAIDGEGWFHTGDIGEIADGFLRITDRKKDLIVTANGKKVAPQALENALKVRCPLVSQVMAYGDKRPYCVALLTVTEEAVKRFGGGDVARAAASAELRSAIQKEVDALNATLAGYESIKKFAILPTELTEASGELTPSMKVKRKVVIERYRSALDGLYAAAGGGD